MSPLDLLPMLYIVGLRGLYISTYMLYIYVTYYIARDSTKIYKDD